MKTSSLSLSPKSDSSSTTTLISKTSVLVLSYFLFSLLNLATLRLAMQTSLSGFLVSRGLTAILLSIAVFRITQNRLFFPILKHTQRRIVFGGAGMTLQILGASQLSISTYALLSRATPVWFSMLTRKKSDAFSWALIALVGLAPLALQAMSRGFLLGIGGMMIGTLLIAFSQKAQVEGAVLESQWLMPFAPALGVSIIGAALAAFSSEHALDLSALGMISGFIMTVAYWIVQPLLLNAKSGGAQMVLCDLGAAVLLGLNEAIQLQSKTTLLNIGVTILVFGLFSLRKTAPGP